MANQVTENWPAKFWVDNCEIAPVSNILIESPHIGGKGLVCIVLGIIDGHRFIECGDLLLGQVDPVIDAAQIVDQGASSKRCADSKAVGPDKCPVDPDVVPKITPKDEQV